MRGTTISDRLSPGAGKSGNSMTLRLTITAIVASLILAGAAIPTAKPAYAAQIASHEFDLVWQRTEAPVANGSLQRSWLWGPDPRTSGMLERYIDADESERLVQYFDKGRMEINDVTADPADPWFVTSGLLTRELISGKIQIGHKAFLDTGSGAAIHFAGDPDPTFPLYRDLAAIVDQGQPDRRGLPVERVLTPNGLTVQSVQSVHADDPDVEQVEYVTYHGPAGVDVGYNVPRAFWDYIHQPGEVIGSNGELEVADPLFQWIYVLGYPIADPFWVEVPVAGVTQWILVQPFERRVLTYTPSNEPDWRVEMGNIGQHYQLWRGGFTDAGSIDGNLDSFGFVAGETWRYGTTYGVDEAWEVLGVSESFVPGSTVMAREELTLEGRRVSYWSVTDEGLFFHGWEMRDGQGSVRDMMLYTPPIHILPATMISGTRATDTRAIGMLGPPQSVTVSATIDAHQLVSTPAGVFGAWRTEIEVSGNADIRHGLGIRFWFTVGVGTIQWIDNGFSAQLRTSTRLDP